MKFTKIPTDNKPLKEIGSIQDNPYDEFESLKYSV